MLNLRDKLTIYLPTFSRQYMLEDVIRYHATTGACIIVTDASTTAWKVPADLVRRVDYRHTPNGTYLGRLRSIVPDIYTPFFIFRSDRRHQTNRALFQCVQYLEDNSEYTSATGIWLSEYELKPYNPIELVTRNGEIDCPYARVRASLLSYQPSYYNVLRTSHVMQLFKVWDALEVYTINGYYREYAQAFFTLLSGKMKQLDCLAGIIQDVPKGYDCTDKKREVASLLGDTALTQSLADILYAYLPDTQDRQCFNATISDAVDAAILRLDFYGASGDQQIYSTVSRFKKIFHILNSDGKIQDNHYVDAVLRLLATRVLEKDFSYNDVRHSFTPSDLEEQQNILELMSICHKKNVLRKIREAKATIRR